MFIRKMLSGLVAVMLAVPLLAVLGAPPGPGWNDHQSIEVQTYMGYQAQPGSTVPIWICLSYGPGNPNRPLGLAYGWPGQSLPVTATGGTLAKTEVVTGPRGCATDTLTGLAAGQTIHVTAAWRTLTTGTGVVTGVVQGGSQTTPKPIPSQVQGQPTKGTPKPPTPKPPTPKKPKTPTPKTPLIAPAPLPTITILAPAQRDVGQPIPATITLLRRGRPDAHAVVDLGTTRGHLSQTTGTTNLLGQIHLTVSQAPVGQVTITAHTGTVQGRATVRVLAHPFPWWALLALIGLLALLIVLIATLRRRRRQGGGHRGTDPHQTL